MDRTRTRCIHIGLVWTQLAIEGGERCEANAKLAASLRGEQTSLV
jgi:hypothetical protein